MDYKILTSASPDSLTREVNEHIKEGWTPVGSHGVVITHSQNRYSGSTHMTTEHRTEYSQTVIRKTYKDE